MLDQVALEAVGDADAQPAGEAVLGRRAHVADAVDVALDDVAAERVAGAQRRLEVDRGRRRSSSPSVVRLSVWFITSASKPSGRTAVAVRQTPSTPTESPSRSSAAKPAAIREPASPPIAPTLDRLDRCPTSCDDPA